MCNHHIRGVGVGWEVGMYIRKMGSSVKTRHFRNGSEDWMSVPVVPNANEKPEECLVIPTASKVHHFPQPDEQPTLLQTHHLLCIPGHVSRSQ